jgi:transcriptional regulator with XRE-family HTH domain
MSRDEVLLQSFAAELKARRSGLKYSQEELAHRAEVNRTYIAKLELARNQPTLCVLHQLALALDTDLPELLQAILVRYKKNQRSARLPSAS